MIGVCGGVSPTSYISRISGSYSLINIIFNCATAAIIVCTYIK